MRLVIHRSIMRSSPPAGSCNIYFLHFLPCLHQFLKSTCARELSRLLLRRFPVEGIDILSSGVAEQQRRIVGRESQRSPVTSDRNEILQVDHLFCLMVADSNSEDRALSPRIQNIDVLSVLRPIRVAKDAFGKVSPLLHLEVEQRQLARSNARCEKVPSVGRPSRREKPALRSRQRRNLVARQVDDANRRSSVTRATTEDNFVTPRRPVRIPLRARDVRDELPGTAARG